MASKTESKTPSMVNPLVNAPNVVQWIKEIELGYEQTGVAGKQNQTPIAEEKRRTIIRNLLFGRVRFYICPYAVYKTTELGRGFLFLQTDKTLQDMASSTPDAGQGGRSVLIHFLTLGEFDSEVCKDDFELALMRTPLKDAIEKYQTEEQVVLLMRFRCGHMALGNAALVPDYRICKKLGHDYYSNNTAGALQLNLDDL